MCVTSRLSLDEVLGAIYLALEMTMATAETDRYVLLLEISDCLGSESIWGSRIIAIHSARSATSGELSCPDHAGVG